MLTYNGDDFDMPYLYARSQDPAIDPADRKPIDKDQVPILVKRESFIKRGIQADPVTIKSWNSYRSYLGHFKINPCKIMPLVINTLNLL